MMDIIINVCCYIKKMHVEFHVGIRINEMSTYLNNIRLNFSRTLCLVPLLPILNIVFFHS